MVTLDVVRVGTEQLRIGTWRGDPAVAFIAPLLERPAPTTAAVQHCCELLAERGYRRVVTAALGPDEAHGFVLAGFTVVERLHLLAHSLRSLASADPAPGVHFRRGRAGDHAAVLAVDGCSFPPFWRFDAGGLDEALAATPAVRFRVAVGHGRVVAYSICGRSGRRGFVQRVAVDPAAQGRGIGRALVLDGLRWLRRWGTDRALVNTQEDNYRALALYERLGFQRQPGGLAVFGFDLADAH